MIVHLISTYRPTYLHIVVHTSGSVVYKLSILYIHSIHYIIFVCVYKKLYLSLMCVLIYYFQGPAVSVCLCGDHLYCVVTCIVL